MRTHSRISRTMRLFAAVLALSASMLASAFEPSAMPMNGRGRTMLSTSTSTATATLLRAEDGAANGAAASSSAAASGDSTPFLPLQKEYGKSLELPNTYASCGQCGASFALTPEAMGTGKTGRRMECSICDHTWFQSRDRLASMREGFEMVPLPERDLDRIALNVKEGRHPKYTGDFKMYVGNISFKCNEADITELFETIGPVGDVSLVTDETGRPRGFGFVTMRNKDEGERALAELDGTDLKGRNLNVRPSDN